MQAVDRDGPHIGFAVLADIRTACQPHRTRACRPGPARLHDVRRDAISAPIDRSARCARRCHALLDAALAPGVRYVDTARSYGLAEQFLSAWCDERRLSDSALTVGSKWGYVYTGCWQLDAPVHEVKRLTIDTLRRQAEESRVILGPRLSLYQIHSATLESGVLDDPAVLAELSRLRDTGLRIGLTVTGPQQADDHPARSGRPDRRRDAVSDGPGDVEPARTVGWRRARGRQGGWLRSDRQGSAGERPADRSARRPGAGLLRAHAKALRRASSRWRPPPP